MTPTKTSQALSGAVATLALIVGMASMETAYAVPCGSILTGGVAPSTGCRNGADGDTSDSAADLNAGSFFGINTWDLVDSTIDGVDHTGWTFWNLSGSVNPNGTRLGVIELASGIWSQFSSLAVVLNGRGGAMDGDVKWAAYQIKPGDKWMSWSYDYVHRLGNASLYGNPRVTVSEPAALAIFLGGLGLGALVLRRRAQA